jgi:hypothetical protein
VLIAKHVDGALVPRELQGDGRQGRFVLGDDL